MSTIENGPTTSPILQSPPAVPPATREAVGLSPIADFDSLPWQERVSIVTRMMQQVSSITDPQELVNVYGAWVQSLRPIDRFVSLSRRDLLRPYYRITRSGLWEDQNREVNPWKQQMPVFERGVLGELIHAGDPVVIDDFTCDDDDPTCEHIQGYRSLMAIPLFENGIALNMVVMLKREPGAFDREALAERVWMSNLFGRATRNLVLSEELGRAYAALDAELRVVADIQRSLLPRQLPSVPGVDFAVHYQTSTQAGGDYYDFFELADGRIGILIADVSGHGSPAAVMMAVTHSIAHTRDRPPAPPRDLLAFLNERLCARYTNNGTFVTAFYAIYDPRDRTLRYCNAGHNPPIIRRGSGPSTSVRLSENGSLPLGIIADETYADATVRLEPGDVLVLYTDGVTESRRAAALADLTDDDADDLFGIERLESLVTRCMPDAQTVIDRTVKAVNLWTDYAPAKDDRTLVVGKFS